MGSARGTGGRWGVIWVLERAGWSDSVEAVLLVAETVG